MKTIKIRNSGVNPFLVNPIKAVLKGEDVGITHCVGSGIMDDLRVGFEFADGKYSMTELENVEFLNEHEFMRFHALLAMLNLKEDYSLKYGDSHRRIT